MGITISPWMQDHRVNVKYQEILKLDNQLSEDNISHLLQKYYDGWQIVYPHPHDGERIMDAIEHFRSYGQESDLLEIMGLLTEEEQELDSVVGGLTAEDVFNRIKSHWAATKTALNRTQCT